MPLKNSQATYGSIAKWLHWTTALCVLVAFSAVHYGHYFYEYFSPGHLRVVGIHTMFGLTAGLLILPRLIWKLINVAPDPDPAPRWQHCAAKYAHWGLYFVLIAAPLTGWMGIGSPQVNIFWLFEIPTFHGSDLFPWLVEGKMGLTFEEWEVPIDFIHKNIMGKWVVWMLILVHVSAALYHHFSIKDNTLRRMVPGMKPKSFGLKK